MKQENFDTAEFNGASGIEHIMLARSPYESSPGSPHLSKLKREVKSQMVEAIHHKIEAAEEEVLIAWKASIDRISSLEKRVSSLKTLLSEREKENSPSNWLEKQEKLQKEVFALQASLANESIK